ncbi:heme ABC transporter ATP-binding protein [Mucilaginibacter auburnensis]|uniref:Iron complex transport system ATP-binding protein n=1 Tax=Mucilaginibacter auburnensis TaxID=1457233 RepID=A0A2H9VW04_9SPHI|nr:heme ABC transporter ATP-binding protein [Mucilaginibacter auburnensis]PJJ85013.1 iron complex transport system ATP-binding protein [Mucilaginibacter auburnensis]
MIDVKNLTYQAGNKKILHGASFNLVPGEMMAVIGANGAGKSTLLKLLCREMEPTSGSIKFNNRDIESYSIHDMAMLRAVLTQHNTVSVMFTVKELVMMGRYPHFENRPSAHDMEVVKKTMLETGITHLSSRNYNTLSGGEQQRVQLARVIAQIYDRPNAFLFLDEPTNGLDLLYQQQILQLARNMANRGYIVISILHDINFASQYADQILILKNGKTVAFGAPLEVINCENIHEAFNIKVKLMECEDFKCPLVIPSGLMV